MTNIIEIKALFNNALTESVKINELVLDAGTQMRQKVNAVAVENYSHAMLEGKADEFPEILVVSLNHPVEMPDGSTLEIGSLVLVDGFHRVEAAHNAKLATFNGRVVEASLETAKYFAMTANSEHGAQLAGKDYQNAIRELYNLNVTWREHGKGKEIAALFGCSTKTVERALKVVKAEIKAEAFAMFKAGATNEDVAEFAVIHIKTAKEWRSEWEDACVKEEEKAKKKAEEGESEKKEEKQKDPKNPMDLSFAEVLRLKDTALKASMLKMLMDAIKEDSQSFTEEPKQEDEQPQPEPEETTEEAAQDSDDPIIDDVMDKLAAEWAQMDEWALFGKSKADFMAMANPKAALKRAYNKLLKQCHSDKFGKDNAALTLLVEAFAKASKYCK